MQADAMMPVGVVIERRESAHPWQDYSWHPAGVLAHAGPARWQVLAQGDGWTRFQAGTLNLELHRGETEGYLANLSQSPPQVFVILRTGETPDEREVEPFHVTACPYEAMGYLEGGEAIVEGVAMPAEIMAFVGEFVASHHADEPFRKRKNKTKTDRRENGGSRPRGRRLRQTS